MNNVRDRLRASGIHLGISLCIAALAATLVFGLWYPFPYREISGGRELLFLLVAVDVITGPLITLAIFNRAKPRRELLKDFTVVGFLQLAALSYGLWTVFAARPVHLVFEYSRMTVIHAIDVDADLLAKAPPSLQKLPVTGPSVISLRPFKNSAEQFDATTAALKGFPLAARSDLWQAYEPARADVLKEAKPVAELRACFSHHAAQIDRAIAATDKQVTDLRYLPLLSRKTAWTVLLDATTAEPLGYLPLDSF